MKGRNGWLLLVAVVVCWDVAAAVTNGESLTYTFRRAVSESSWRWPLTITVLLLVTHLFLPPRLQKYDPLDRLYQRFQPNAVSQTHEPPEPIARHQTSAIASADSEAQAEVPHP